MTLIFIALLIITIMFLGVYGGQKEKSARRFGIPILAFLASLRNFKWKNLSFLFLAPVLIMGYGESSLLGKILPDTFIRVVYALLLSIPFIFWGFKIWIISAICLIGAFQVRAGLLFSIGSFEVLIEDIVRYGVLGGLLSFIIFKRKEK